MNAVQILRAIVEVIPATATEPLKGELTVPGVLMSTHC